MTKRAVFTYRESDPQWGECYILETFDKQGKYEGIVAVYKFKDNKYIPFNALTEAIELSRRGYYLDI